MLISPLIAEPVAFVEKLRHPRQSTLNQVVASRIVFAQLVVLTALECASSLITFTATLIQLPLSRAKIALRETATQPAKLAIALLSSPFGFIRPEWSLTLYRSLHLIKAKKTGWAHLREAISTACASPYRECALIGTSALVAWVIGRTLSVNRLPLPTSDRDPFLMFVAGMVFGATLAYKLLSDAYAGQQKKTEESLARCEGLNKEALDIGGQLKRYLATFTPFKRSGNHLVPDTA